MLRGAPRYCYLRDLQQQLCRYYKEPFPSMLAKVTVLDKEFCDYMDMPFSRLDEDEGAEIQVQVAFEKNIDEPFWHDWADRRAMKYTLEEEIEDSFF